MAKPDPGAGLAILVTRPLGQGDALRQALEQRGHRVWHQPLLELEPLTVTSTAERRCLMELDGYQHIIFVSANAVRYGMAWIADYWPQLPVGINWYSVGETTAGLLESYGVRASTPGDNMSSEGLLELAPLKDVCNHRVLIVRGAGGRTLLREELTQRGAKVDDLACYRRDCPTVEPGALARLLEESRIDLILISSGEGLANLRALLTPQETTNFSHIAMLVPSQRVADQAAAAGFNRLVIADNASDGAMLRAVDDFSRVSGE